jgi:hypothetical protein
MVLGSWFVPKDSVDDGICWKLNHHGIGPVDLWDIRESTLRFKLALMLRPPYRTLTVPTLSLLRRVGLLRILHFTYFLGALPK